ncbi:MAG: periplasmic heavy metal sensor [Methylacidiphilales bacterium]|nr:periplasmic heavy metal sensor [Candidatus Methylacidiphilales bacterium]
MNRKTGLVLLVVLLAVAGYVAAYFLRVQGACPYGHDDPSGLAWMRKEFHVTDAQFGKIAALHKAYKPLCDERCRRARDAELELQQFIDANTGLTPELTAAFDRSCQVREECRRGMMEHIYAVSREMEPSQGRRFVEIMSRHMLFSTPGAQMPMMR